MLRKKILGCRVFSHAYMIVYIVAILVYIATLIRIQTPTKIRGHEPELIERLQNLERFVRKARQHKRGTRTTYELNRTLTIIEDIFTTDLNITSDYKRVSKDPHSVCRQNYSSPKHNIEKCDYQKPIHELVTVLTHIKDGKEKHIKEKIQNLTKSAKISINKEVTLIIAARTFAGTKVSSNIVFVKTMDKSDGEIWNKLIQKVTTPYVLVADNLLEITNDVQLERMVREMESQTVAAVGGAVRYPDSRWRIHCYQHVHKTHILRYDRGYDESFHECWFCDFIASPFLTSKSILEQFPFEENLNEDSGLFEDWFLRLVKNGYVTILCPDVMFSVQYKKEAKHWPEFVSKWDLYSIMTPLGRTITSDCSVNSGNNVVSKVSHPCLRQHQTHVFSTVMSICEENGLLCRAWGDVVLGAAKLEGVTPWQRDANIHVEEGHFKRLQELVLEEINLSITSKDKTLRVTYENAIVEVISTSLTKDDLMHGYPNTTKMLYDGQWLTTYFNPGSYLLDVYGCDLYRHKVHFLNIARTWHQPKLVTTWPECDDPDEPNCLDQFNEDGSLQFKLLLP